MYLQNNSIGSKLLFINSEKIPSNQFKSATKTYFTIELDHPIECNEEEFILLSLYSCSIPNTWYSTRETENRLMITVIDGLLEYHYDIVITPGNYTIKQIYSEIISQLTILNTQFSSILSFSYVPQTNRTMVTFTSSDYADSVILKFSSSSMAKTLGFTNQDVTLSGSQSITSPNMIMIYDIYSVFLRTNFGTQSYNELGRITNILERIPVSNQNSVTYYQAGIMQHKTILSQKSIKSFDLYLTTHDELEMLDLNGMPFELCLKFDIVHGLDRAETVDYRQIEETV